MVAAGPPCSARIDAAGKSFSDRMNSLRCCLRSRRYPFKYFSATCLAKETDGGRRTSVFSKDRCSREVLFRSDEFASVLPAEQKIPLQILLSHLFGKGNRWWPPDLRVQQGSMQQGSPFQIG